MKLIFQDKTDYHIYVIEQESERDDYDKLPEDHVYEWGFDELKDELEKHFTIESVVGTFIQMPNFHKAQRVYNQDLSTSSRQFPQAWTDQQVLMLQERFGKQFARMVLATPYPQFANNCAWVLRKE